VRFGLGHNYQVDWQVFRRIIQDHGVRNRLDALVDAAAASGADIGHPNRRLRHLDALLWMRAARPNTPFADAVARLDQIPGVGVTAARVIVAEVGVDMTRFPTSSHLTSWAKFAPGVKESAGRKKGRGSTGHGNRYLASALGEAAVGSARTSTFLGEHYRRLARRRGGKKAMVAVGRSILVIVWQLLSNPDTQFRDLGPDFYANRLGADRTKRNHIRQLEALGYKVTLEPAA